MAVKNSKVSLKSLQAEINIFRELLENTTKELAEVKEELNHVKKEVTKLNANYFVQNNEQKKSYETNEKCKMCDKSFSSRKNLKIHYNENHRQQIKCKFCDETFEKNCNLEEHIRKNHSSAECFKCKECDKDFVLKWRLKKHQETHKNKSVKKCHYFNNNKQCPFENIGCMFAHSMADTCRYDTNCTNKLCSFQHKKDEAKGTIDNKEDDVDSEDENLMNMECGMCERIFYDENELEEHISIIHEFCCENCDLIFESNLLLDNHSANNHNNC